MLSQWSISALVLPIYEADSDLCYAVIQVPIPHLIPTGVVPMSTLQHSLHLILCPRIYHPGALRRQHLQRGLVQCGGWRRGKVQESQKAFLKGMVHLT